MFWLNLFPIPRRFERVPGALAFAVAAAAAAFALKEGTQTGFAVLACALVLLAFVYMVRFKQKAAWQQFFTEENRKLLAMEGGSGPAGYIPTQKETCRKITHPEVKGYALLNLSTGQLAAADPDAALETLESIKANQMNNPTIQLSYWNQVFSAYFQKQDIEKAEQAYNTALEILSDVSDMVKISFMPTEIQYRLLKGEYQLALDQINEIPAEKLNDASRDQMDAMKICALMGLGVTDKAEKLIGKIQDHDMLPSTRKMMEWGKGLQVS